MCPCVILLHFRDKQGALGASWKDFLRAAQMYTSNFTTQADYFWLDLISLPHFVLHFVFSCHHSFCSPASVFIYLFVLLMSGKKKGCWQKLWVEINTCYSPGFLKGLHLYHRVDNILFVEAANRYWLKLQQQLPLRMVGHTKSGKKNLKYAGVHQALVLCYC